MGKDTKICISPKDSLIGALITGLKQRLPKVDVGPNFIRVRIRNPGDFQEGSFRVINIDQNRGIRATIGRLKGKTTTTTQGFIFDKKKGWTAASALAWVKERT